MRPIIQLVFAALIPSSIAVAQEKQSYGKISLTALEDKIQGGWAGQMIGVSFGFPTEFEYREQIMPAHAHGVGSKGKRPCPICAGAPGVCVVHNVDFQTAPWQLVYLSNDATFK